MASISQIKLTSDGEAYDIEDSTARRLATTSQTGQVKPDGLTTKTDQDGTIHATETRELTQAQFDALSQEEKNNGTTYFISDGHGEGNVSELDDLTDVTITSPTANQVLKYDGSKWVNGNGGGGGGVDPSTIAPTEPTSTSSKAYAVGDLLYYEGVLYKVTTAIAQGGSIVTSGSGKNVEVTTIEDKIDDVEVSHEEDIRGVNKIKITATSGVVYGVTLTVAKDGTITANGTATQDVQVEVARFTGPMTKNLKGFFKMGATQTGVKGFFQSITTGGTRANYFTDNGDSVTIPYTQDVDIIGAWILIQNGSTATNAVYKPMLYDADLPIPSYRPYNETAIQNQIAAMQEAGAVNHLDVDAVSQVIRGITYTANSDKSVTINGTNTESGQSVLPLTTDYKDCSDLAGKNVIFGGFNVGIPVIYGYAQCAFYNSSNTEVARITTRWADSGVLVPSSAIKYKAWIFINPNHEINNVTVYPMLYDARLVNLPYQPFTMTNRELTDSKADASDFNGLKVVIYKTTAPTVTTADVMRANIPGIPTSANLTMILGAWARNNNNNVIYDVLRGNGLTEILYMNAYQLRNKTLPQDFVTTYGGNDFWAAIGYFPTTP